MNKYLLFIVLLLGALFSCKKIIPVPDPVFEINIQNEFNELNGRFAIFVSTPGQGDMLAFRWIPGEDTVQLQVPGSTPGDRYDCTVVKISTIIAPGTGVRDTFLNLSTYTQLQSGASINLRDLVYQKASDLKFTLSGFNTLDSIVVPDAYAIQKPQAINNYAGEYRCFHSGNIWMRILVNGEHFWRFVRFNDISGPVVEANTLDANIFTFIFAPTLKINLPFVAEWEYQADGIIDTAQLRFFPLSRQYLPPGSYIQDIDKIEVTEPINNEQFEPNRPYQGFRLKTKGVEQETGGYTYYSDHFYPTLPAALPAPDFDLAPTVLSDNRLIAVECIGNFDLLVFSRSRTGSLNINWEVFTAPKQGVVDYRLPDVPKQLGDLYLPLQNYDLGGVVRARAEAYEQSMSYEGIIKKHLASDDVLWQAKAGYIGREETY